MKEAETFIDYRCNPCATFRRFLKFQNVFNSRLPISQFLRFLMYFTHNVSNETIAKFLGISAKTINTFVVALQGLIQQRLARAPARLGGPGRCVQMDESYFGKRKYNTGRLRRYAWVFGAIDTTSKEFMMQSVANRKCESIGPLIKEHVLRDSIVHTDKYATYLAFFSRNDEYEHGWVNHKLNFVDPETGIHTQHIENLWGQFKKFKRKKCYSKLCYLDLYIAEFTMRKKYGKLSMWKMFEELLDICIKVL
ncbi:hypothetical protein PAPHI01_2626 [Pancytospora philotis]|nr:hypothetical protein PAPHI01_2626 [Pancytospora philotis]